MSTTKRITKRLLAVVLTVMMLMSMVTIGITSASAAKVELAETGATISSTGSSRLYFNMSAVSWWTAGTNGNGNFAYFFNNSTNKNAWSAHAVQYSGSTYYVTIPSGVWSGVILTRNNTSTSPSWDNKWNQTGDITLSSTSNYISKFSEGSTTVTWGTAIKVASAAALTASANTVAVGEAVTLTSSLSSNANLNTIWSTTYSVDPATATVENGTFVATEAGEYTVTANVTYYANGYTSISSSTTATTTITVEDATTSSVAVDDSATGDEPATEPTTTEPTVTDPAETNGTAFELDWAETNGLYAYAGATDEAIDAEAWQRWLSKSEGRVFYLPASASKTEVIIYNSYANTVTVNGVKIDAGCYNTVPYVAGTAYTVADAENQTLVVYNTDAEASLFINTDKAKGSVVNDDDAETETKLSNLSGIWYDYIVAASKNREAKKLGGAVASADGIVVEQVKKIKGRGNTTWEETKKPFNITFAEAIGIDGMDSAAKWSLLANAKDDSLMRNRIVYDMANEVGMKYACDSRFVDFYVDGRYMGSYQLVQKIEMGEGTVMGDLIEPEVEDVIDDETGETISYPKENFDFVLELDTQKNADNAGDLTFSTSRGQVMTHKIPDKPADEQVAFMKAKYQAVEDALYGDDLATLETLVDMNDMAKAYLINEISKNVDAGITSCYFVYNADDAKFYLSPVWDYDNALGNMGDTTRKDLDGNYLDLGSPSDWYASELAHYDANFTGKNSVFSMACHTTSKTADGKAFADYVAEVWESDFADLIDILEGTIDGEGRLKSIDDYKALLAKSGQWNYENNRINGGWTLKQNWTSDHSSLTMYDFDAETNSVTAETKKYNANNAQDMNQYAGDWAVSRLNWISAQYAGAEVPAPKMITIYFENNWKWPDAKIYIWGSSIASANNSWPGVALTKVVGQNDAGYDIYEIQIPEDATGIIFNGTGEYGAEQSADIKGGWYEGICYYMTYDSATNTKPCGSYDYKVPEETTTAPAETTTAPVETEPSESVATSSAATTDETQPTETTTAATEATTEAPVADTITIYFENNWKWPDAKIYYWGSTTHENPAWNGIALTKVVGQNDAGYDIYEITIPADVTGIIFNGTGEYGAEQSADITKGWYDGICYYMTYDSATNTKPCGSYEYKVPEETTTAPAETTTAPVETEPSESVATSSAATTDETQPTETTTAATEATTEAPVADTITIYFENNWKWPDAKIYYWGSKTGENPAWSGISLTKVVGQNDAGYDIYEITIPADITGIIFNGTGEYGFEQSADITEGWYDGICYYMTYDSATNTKPCGSYEYKVTEETTTAPAEETDPTEATTEATEGTTASNPASGDQDATEATTVSVPDMPTVITVYAINSAKWDEVYAYCWDTDPAVAWPGVAMDKTEETVNGFDVYALSFDSAYVNVIFNNNDNGAQTADLTAMDGQYYDIKGGKWYESLDDVPALSTLSTDRYLVGEFNNWSTTANEFMLKAEGDSYGYVTLTLEANTTYEFKIVREGTWTSCATPITATVEGLTFSSSNSDNCTITTTEAGEYVFAFGLNNSQLSVTYPGEEVTDPTDPAPDTTVKLAGDFTDPTWGDGAIEMTLVEEGGTVYTTELYFAAGTYEFKIMEFGEWLGNDGTIDNVMAEEGGWTFKDGAGNCTLTTTGGTYTFTFDTETDKLVLTAVLDEIETPVYNVIWNEGNFTVNAPATIDEAADLSFTVDAAEGYTIAAVIYNMTELEAVDGVYTIENVQSDVELLIVEAAKADEDETPDIPIVEQKLTVMFVDEDNNIIGVAKVDKGTNLPAPQAPEKAGYTFIGWSADTSNVQTDMLVVAQYKKITVTPPAPTHGTLKIDVTGGTGFTMTVDGVTRPQGTAYYNSNFAIGTNVTVTANATSDAKFIGWMSAYNVILSTDTTYTFVTTGGDQVKAVYDTEVEGVELVIFKNDKSNQILDMQFYASTDTIAFPADPSSSTWNFLGWTMTEAEIQAAIANGESVTVTGNWELKPEYVTVTVIGGTATGTTNAEGQFQKGVQMTVTADPAEDGKSFAYWRNGDGAIVSYEEVYKLFPRVDMTLEAVYAGEGEELDYTVLVNINSVTEEDTRIVYNYSWYTPVEQAGFTHQAAGMIFVLESNYDENNFVLGADNVIKATSSTTTPSYTTNQGKKMNSGETWYARAWVQYLDADGQVQYAYSDVVVATKG